MARTLLSVTVLALLVAAAFAQDVKVNAPGTQVNTKTDEQGTKTKVNAPYTEVKTKTNEQGQSYTKVDAPGTKVMSTPQGTVVNAPGKTVATGNKDGAYVQAPGTNVVTDKQKGTTYVDAPFTNVGVTPGETRVVAPFVDIVVPNRTGRKMLRA